MRLVELKLEDFDFLKKLLTNREVYQFIGNGKKWKDEKIRNFIGYSVEEQKLTPDERNNFFYKIVENGEMVGIIGVKYKKKKFSLTVFIYPHLQGKGYFSKALNFFLRRLRRYKPYLKFIYSQVHLKNKKMSNIMENKYNFVKVYKIGDIPVAEYKIPVSA